MDSRRLRNLNNQSIKGGSVIYWMQREQRVNDNWALIYSIELAKKENRSLKVIFFLNENYVGKFLRQIHFIIEGLKQVEEKLIKLNIPFEIHFGDPVKSIPSLVEIEGIGIIVTDFNPIRIYRTDKDLIAKKLKIPVIEVDGHNIVPCWIASTKQEFGAYTLRPKINRLLPEFLTDFPQLEPLKNNSQKIERNKWTTVYDRLKIDSNVWIVDWLKPGEENGEKILKEFIETKLNRYHEKRNDPNENVISNLSPYLHFGQISAQRVAKVISNLPFQDDNIKSFLEELIVRKELSDNFCFYNNNYDSFDGFPDWAKDTLNRHRKDKREFLYSLDEFENGNTHDALWNAAQNELKFRGKMHGYMRMYWAKKILEWTKSPEEALTIAIYLNDKYELDGFDPNGYTGCAWSIGGVHDRPWFERPIFGEIRYMNYSGCKRKFDVNKYIQTYLPK